MNGHTEKSLVLLIPRICRGGAELQAVHLANSIFNKLSKTVTIVSVYPIPPRNTIPELSSNISLYSLDKKQGKTLHLLFAIFKLYRMLKYLNPSRLILFLSYSEFLYLALFIFGLRIPAFSFVRARITPPSSFFYKFLGILYGSLFTEIFVNSPTNILPTLRMYSRLPVLIPNYTPSFSVCKSSIKLWPKDSIHLIYIARFLHEKNHEFLLHCLQHLCSIGINVSLTLIGSRNNYYDSTISPLIESLCLTPRVEVYFDVVDISRYFQSHSISVFPSFYGEGTPNFILESFALSSPVLCSSLYRDTNLPCMYYDHNSICSFTDNLFKLLDSPQDLIDASSAFLHDQSLIRSRVISRYFS